MTGLLRPWVAGLVVLGLSVAGCGNDPSRQGAASASTADVGTCRGQAARQEAAGIAHIDWVSLAQEFPTRLDAVFTAEAIEDLGERDILRGDDEDGVDLPRLARFTRISTLAGHIGSPAEALLSPYQLRDATAELTNGAELLVWIRPQPGRPPNEPPFASTAAVEPDGDVVILGDCVPAWTPAFARYAARNGEDLTAGELLRRILVEPEGPRAIAFRASDEAGILAGPTDG
jgi:hypothetical protein